MKKKFKMKKYDTAVPLNQYNRIYSLNNPLKANAVALIIPKTQNYTRKHKNARELIFGRKD